MQQFQMTGEPAPPMPSRVSAWSVYDVFTLADDEQLFIGAVSDKQFLTLCKVLERPDLAEDEALATNAQRVAVRPELLKWLGDTLHHHKIDELTPKLEAAGLPYAPIVRPDQLVDDPHLIAKRRPGRHADRRRRHAKVVLLPLLMGGRRPGVRSRCRRSANTPTKCWARCRA